VAFCIADPGDDPRRLSQAVVQICDMLGLYQAELARILGLQCADIGRLANGKWCLQPGSHAWCQAQQLVRLQQRLYALLQGDGVAMVHWLHVTLPTLGATPHRLLVDEGRMADVLGYLAAVPGQD
jgi:hypothetical protein